MYVKFCMQDNTLKHQNHQIFKPQLIAVNLEPKRVLIFISPTIEKSSICSKSNLISNGTKKIIHRKQKGPTDRNATSCTKNSSKLKRQLIEMCMDRLGYNIAILMSCYFWSNFSNLQV